MSIRILTLLTVLSLFPLSAWAADPLPKEDDYYKMSAFKVPDGVMLEAGATELMPDGRLAVSSRRGEIWMIDKPLADDASTAKFTKFAEGLHEVLGLAERDGWLYVTQRCELSRLKDTNGDGRADLFETVSDGWEVNGDYHEYAFGSKFDKDGNLWVVLCLTGSFGSDCKFRGWCLRVSADGKLTPTCSGIRSPGGIGANAVGDIFYTDNQGPWNGTCSLKHLEPGSFQGHPGGNKWLDLAKDITRPKEPKSGSRIMTEAKLIPELMPPACQFPYQKMGNSASGITCDTTGGKFGPFVNQLFVGDQSASTVMRVDLEKVNGRYQGACFPFRQGFGSGTLAMQMSPTGAMFVGGTNRGWGSRGNKPFAWERLNWTGKVPFEVLIMRAKPDGFELTYTEPVDPATAGDAKSYKLKSYCYIYQSSYGSPEVDQAVPEITKIEVSPDKKSVKLTLALTEGQIYELDQPGVRSAAGLPLLHSQAYYSLNYIPAK